MSEPGLAAVDPAQFAATVAAMPDAQLAELMRGELREAILDEIFRRMQEHFDPARSAQLDLVIHFTVGGQAGGEPDRFEVIVRDDACRTGRGGSEAPGLGLTLDAADLLRLVTNQVSGMDLYLERRMKIDGNIILANRIAGLFTVPGAAPAAAGATENTPPNEGT